MTMNFRPTAISAVEGLVAANYNREEATAIRPFLPLHFDSYPALPRDNYDYWNAYRAVQDALTYDRHTYRFFFSFNEEVPYVNNNRYLRIHYESPSFTTNFIAIEFIRHFGKALFTVTGDPSMGRQLTYINGSIRIKTHTLLDIFEQIPTKDIPPNPSVFTVEETLRAWRAGDRVERTLHDNSAPNIHWVNPAKDGWDLARYLDLQMYRRIKGVLTLGEVYTVHEEVNSALLTTKMFPSHTTYHPSLIVGGYVYGEILDPRGYVRPDIETDRIRPKAFRTVTNDYSLTMPTDIHRMFTNGEWGTVL